MQQNRNTSSVLFRSRRATTIAAAATVVLSGLNVASALVIPTYSGSSSANGAIGGHLRPDFFRANVGAEQNVGGHGSNDITRTYTGAAGTGLFSSPTNWTPNGTPVAGDALTFGATPAGNYSVTNDLQPTAFGDLIENRTNIGDTVTLNNGYRGNRIEVTRGALTVNGGTSVLTSELGATALSTEYSVRVGVGTNSGTININSTPATPANFTYNDFLHGSAGGTGFVNISGANTVLNTASADGTTSRSDFRGGGGGTSTVNISNGAVVNANLWLANGSDTTTISSGAVLNMNDYTFGNTTGGRFGGQMEIGFFNNVNAPATSAFTIDNATVNTTFFTAASGTNTTTNDGYISNVVIQNGGTLNAGTVSLGNARGAIGNLTVTGTGSKVFSSRGTLVTSEGDTDGTGSANITISNGGSATFTQADIGSLSAADQGANYFGTNMVVDGPTSSFKLVGIPGVAPAAGSGVNGTNPIGANFFVGAAGQRSIVSVNNGALLDLTSTSTANSVAQNPDLPLDATIPVNENGALIMNYEPNSNTTINVDGANSRFNSGTFVQVSQRTAATTAALTNAVSVFNVRNGGTFHVVDDGIEQGSGNAQFGLAGTNALVSAGASIAINVGGGVGAADNTSSFEADGSIFLGGGATGGTDRPNFVLPGIQTIVTINNGDFAAGGIFVGNTAYSGGTGPNPTTNGNATGMASRINVNRGTLSAGLLSVRGGQVVLSPTAPAGTAVLQFDEVAVDRNGFIDIGKSGGVSFLVNDTSTNPPTVDTDLGEIKALIIAGIGGGNNSIKSTALTPNTAIGYALRLPNSPRTSFLGITFEPADSAVLFRVTLKGDADLTGTVDFQDLVSLSQNYNGTGKEWFNGDFDYDGDVDFQDLIPLAQNYNGTFSIGEAAALGGGDFAADWALAQSFVPEPASLSLLVGAAGLLGRRRR